MRCHYGAAALIEGLWDKNSHRIGRAYLQGTTDTGTMNENKTEHHIQMSEVLPYTSEQLYSLVADVERYPEFLPWCRGSRVKEGDDEVIAELTIGYGPAMASFTTRNRNRPGKEIRLALIEGPFRRLEGAWGFKQEKEGKTRMSLDLRFQFDDHGLGKLFDSVFENAMERILDAFKKRAQALYGSLGDA